MARLSITTLGDFHITLNGELLDAFESNKVRALLAYLAVEVERAHTRDRLIGLLWPDQPERAARRDLSQALYNLRQTIRDAETDPPFLYANRRAVQFNGESDYWLDATDFASRLEGIQQMKGTSTSQIMTLEVALHLYQGNFLKGFLIGDSFPFSEWASLQRERLHRLALAALRRLTHHYERRRDYERARHYAHRQVELEPWCEEAHRQLMRVLARNGQRSAALAQYERCCHALYEELGVEPQRETTALYERIRTAGTSRRHNLPAQFTPLVGRKEELSRIAERLENPNCRLLTLVGPGGIGKTRLALQAAWEALNTFLHGVYFIPLAPVNSKDLLTPTVANALGLQFHGTRDPLDQLVDYVRVRELLWVLDGFEHLLQDARWVTAMLKAAPYVKILVTSRERLNLRAEWLIGVDGLPYPQHNEVSDAKPYAAVQLFLKQAMRVRAGFTLSQDNTPHVIHICQLLDGLPLGVELAAALARTRTCARIAHEMDRDLDLLVTSLRDVPGRHRSLRAVFEHSWRLLQDVERAVLARLSVFRDPFPQVAGRAVALATPGTLATLLEKSLLHQDSSGRYDLHALVRQYAAEKLREFPEQQHEAQQRHCYAYADLLYRQASALKGSQHVEAQTEISEALGDIRAAWEWAIEHAAFDALNRSLESLHLFYRTRGRYREGCELLALAARSVPAGSALQAKLWARQADLYSWLSEYDAAQTLVERSIGVLQRLGAQHDLGFALEVLGRVAYCLGEYEAAQTHFQASITIFRQTGDRWGLAQALNYFGHVMCGLQEEYSEAIPLYEESLALSRQMGNRAGIARALINLGAIERNLEHYDRAKRFYREAAEISRETGHRRHLAISLGNLGDVACTCGEYERATELLEESLTIKRELGDRFSLIYTLSHLGRVAAMTGQLQKARVWYDEALQTAHDIGATGHVADVLISMARLLVMIDEREWAVELLQVALDNACDDQEVIQAAADVLLALESELSAPLIASCRERGKTKSLETVIAEILDRPLRSRRI